MFKLKTVLTQQLSNRNLQWPQKNYISKIFLCEVKHIKNLIHFAYKAVWEPLTVKRALAKQHTPQQLQCPLGRALPSDNV
jgi:hypothetical protein